MPAHFGIMRGMNSLPDWLAAPPANHPVRPLLAHDGSLTDRLKASGLPFSVEVAAWHAGPARAEQKTRQAGLSTDGEASRRVADMISWLLNQRKAR